jgi:hypothetical protein
MLPQTSTSVSAGTDCKIQRSLDMNMKLIIIQLCETGILLKQRGGRYGLFSSTLFKILKNKENMAN